MSLYPELLNCLRVTDEDIAHFKSDNPGFCGFDTSRVSRLLTAQLTSASKYRLFSSFSVTDVIQQLEGVGRGICSKEGEPFRRLPLLGLWKVHFFDARFLFKNLTNHWGLAFDDCPRFKALCSQINAEEERSPSKHGWQGRLAHELVVGGYEKKARKKKLTGEWIIFAKHEGVNYYLCIAKHSTSADYDRKILALVRAFCITEFPFLFGNAP